MVRLGVITIWKTSLQIIPMQGSPISRGSHCFERGRASLNLN